MASEVFILKTQKWIKSVGIIQRQLKQRFSERDYTAFANCIGGILKAMDGKSSIADGDLDILEAYARSTQPDEFKAAVENFIVWLKKNNTSGKLKELYDVLEEENYLETLQKTYDSYEYEHQKVEEEKKQNSKPTPSIGEESQKWFMSFLDVQNKIEELNLELREDFNWVLGSVLFGEPNISIGGLIDFVGTRFNEEKGQYDDFGESLLTFLELSDKYLRTTEGISEFRGYLTEEEIEGLNHFVNYNFEEIEAMKATKEAFKVSDAWIRVKDCDGKMIDKPSLVDNTVQYVYYCLRYEAPASMKDVGLKTSIYYPDGKLKHTLYKVYNLQEGGGVIYADGFGSDNGGSYDETGTWTVIFSVKDREVYTLKFKVITAYLPPQPTIRIDSIRFDNCDNKCNIITKGELPVTTQYVTPTIKYTRLRVYGKIRLGCRITNPDGTIRKGNESLGDLSYVTSFIPGASGEYMLTGWGSSSGNTFLPGTYKFEILQGKNVICSTSFRVGAVFDSSSGTFNQTRSTPPPPPAATATAPSKSNSDSNKSNKGCSMGVFLGAVILVLIGWFGGKWVLNKFFAQEKIDYVQVLDGYWNGQISQTDATLAIDSIANDTIYANISAQREKKVETHYLAGVANEETDSVYFKVLHPDESMSGMIRLKYDKDSNSLHGLLLLETSDVAPHVNVYKADSPKVEKAKKETPKKKKKKRRKRS